MSVCHISMYKLINNYTLTLWNGEEVLLKKGMNRAEVIALLGKPCKVEQCRNENNEKLIFKINSNSLACSRYAVLFIQQALFYVAKIN